MTTRCAEGDLLLSFTSGANSNPNSTKIAALITKLYKDCYTVMEGDQTHYHATEANFSAALAGTMFTVVQGAASRIVNEWAMALRNGSETKMPKMEFTQEEKDQLCDAYGLSLRFASHEDDPLNEQGDEI